MKNSVALVGCGRLIPHERVNEAHLAALLCQIKRDGFIDEPVVVDEVTMVILDGHHRYTVATRLGLRHLPVLFVDYRHHAVKVRSWRPGERVTKKMVVTAGLSGNLLAPKTSRHLIARRPYGLKIPLHVLR